MTIPIIKTKQQTRCRMNCSQKKSTDILTDECIELKDHARSYSP